MWSTMEWGRPIRTATGERQLCIDKRNQYALGTILEGRREDPEEL